MKPFFKKAWNIISTAIVVLVVLCAVFLMGSRLLGFRVFNVISGSMTPVYNVGDLIYVQKVEPKDVKVGDDITFVLNEDLVVATHRVVEVNTQKGYFITQGLTNATKDSPVLFENLIGKPIFKIAKLGYVSDFIQNPPGMYITIAVGALLLVLVFVPDLFNKKKKEQATAIIEAQNQIDAANEENERLRAELEALRSEMDDKKSE